MGGTRYNARGIDEDGNCANFVECETILLRREQIHASLKKTTLYSYVQVRASVPLFWKQHGVSKAIHFPKKPDANSEVFIKHFTQNFEDFHGNKHVVLNLLSEDQSDERILSETFKK